MRENSKNQNINNYKMASESKAGEEIDKYTLLLEDIEIKVHIMDVNDYVLHYDVDKIDVGMATRIILNDIRSELAREVLVSTEEILDPRKFKEVKERFFKNAIELIRKRLPTTTEDEIKTLAVLMVNEMIGLGDIEYALADDDLEEIVVNCATEPVWVYHKKYQWLKTNILIETETMIGNYSARIAREVGREINTLHPLLDAHLTTGDRVNATLFPVSTMGNTITIRKFSRTPWTMIHMMDPSWKTSNAEVAAFIWLAIEYELSVIVAGGTGSGKTSLMNALMPFMTHWVPLVTHPPNPHGEGEVSMLDLVENSLRMRPDRIVIGEVRRKREAEVMFEAMHTGHSVYATFHAERATEVVDRITNPPMSIPGTVLSSLHLIVVQYRNRRTGQRRTFEVVELVKKEGGGLPDTHSVFQWIPKNDVIKRINPSVRVMGELELFTGMTEKEMWEDVKKKADLLLWLQKYDIKDVNSVGKVVAEYYINKSEVLEAVANDSNPKEIIDYGSVI